MHVPARHVAVIPGAAVRTLSLLLHSQPENTCQAAAVHPGALAQPPQEGGRVSGNSSELLSATPACTAGWTGGGQAVSKEKRVPRSGTRCFCTRRSITALS